MADDTKHPEEEHPFGLEAARVIELGSALADIEPLAGFQVLMSLLRDEKVDAALRSLKDEARSRKEWRGYIEGIDFLLTEIPRLIESARELKSYVEADTDNVIGARLGSGSLAG